MKTLAAAIIAFTVLFPGTALATDTNQASYWESQTTHESVCYKHEGGSSHGYLSGGGVVLNTFDPSWPGDHWELLVVKGGSVDYGDGPGNKVYNHPSAGTVYLPPLNAAGQQAAVSHWIVCKGTEPPVVTTTTTTTTSTTTTTTTVPEQETTTSTTTTVPDTTSSTTTTIPELSTTSTLPTDSSTSTTLAPTTTVSVTTTTLSVPTTTGPSTTVQPTTTAVVVTTVPAPTTTIPTPKIPETGSSALTLALIAGTLVLVGGTAFAAARRKR